MRPGSFCLVSLLLVAPACKSSSPKNLTMEELYQASLRDLVSDEGMGAMSSDVQERQKERQDAARRAWLGEKLTSPQDHLWCAAVLSDSDALEDLALAHKLALRAEEMGEPRGLPLSAEIVDKQLLKRGQPQRYGTQMLFDPVVRRYRLWDVDPSTTDEDRRAMGVPPLEQLIARAEQADRDLGERLRGQKPAAPTYVPDDN